MCYRGELLSARAKLSCVSPTQLQVHQIARPRLRTVNSSLFIGFSESILKSSKTYEKYTVYNKKGMNGFCTFFTSSKIFNFSFHHFMKIFLFNLLLIRRIWTRIFMAVRIAFILASRRLETLLHAC